MTNSMDDVTKRLKQVEEEFVELWGTMGSLWGINPTMARIHGLLFITGAVMTMDDIKDRLEIARGNVSMNLTKLVEWGLIKRVHRRGDRRDYFESIRDVWEMLTQVATQRKRREVDPLMSTLRRCKEMLSVDSSAQPEVDEHRKRIEDLLKFLQVVDVLASRFFENHRNLREAFELLSQQEPEALS